MAQEVRCALPPPAPRFGFGAFAAAGAGNLADRARAGLTNSSGQEFYCNVLDDETVTSVELALQLDTKRELHLIMCGLPRTRAFIGLTQAVCAPLLHTLKLTPGISGCVSVP